MRWWTQQSGLCSRTLQCLSENLVALLSEPTTRALSRYQDMTQPLSAYFVDTSHNTYLEVVVARAILATSALCYDLFAVFAAARATS